MADLIADINQDLVFHEPTTLDLHVQIQQLKALVVLLTARVSDLETQWEARCNSGWDCPSDEVMDLLERRQQKNFTEVKS